MSRFLAHSVVFFDSRFWPRTVVPLLNLFYKPLLDPSLALLSQGIQEFIDRVLSAYR